MHGEEPRLDANIRLEALLGAIGAHEHLTYTDTTHHARRKRDRLGRERNFLAAQIIAGVVLEDDEEDRPAMTLEEAMAVLWKASTLAAIGCRTLPADFKISGKIDGRKKTAKQMFSIR